MARKFLVAIDLNKNELQNAVVQNLATAPSTPAAGQIYYNTADNKFYYYNGTSWVDTASVSFGNVTAQTTYGASSSNGVATTASRSDHTHGTPSLTSVTPSTQAIGDTAVVGTGTAPAREDHKHAMPAFGTVTGQTSYGASSGNGSSVNIARADHTHGTPSLSTNVASNITATAATNGTGTAPAKDDHVHGFTPGNFAISAFGQATANVNLNSNKITNLATPTADTDAANKGYVDGVAQGLDVKDSVRAATTTAGTLASSFANGSVIDGVTLATGNRILIKNQATASENGIYTVNATGAPTRAVDMSTSAEFPGAFTFVEEGTTLADTGWVCTTNAPVTVGSTAINFAQFSGAGTYTASGGITLTGSNFAITNANVGTWAGNPTSANLAAAVTDETGSGSLVFATSPTLVTPNIGVATGTSFNSITALASTTPNANGTGAVGTSTAVARADHTHPISALTLGTGLTGTSYNGSTAVTAAIDTSVVVRKYAVSVGDGTSTAITVTHNLNTRDVQVTLYDNTAPYAEVIADVEHATVNTVTLRFSVAPTSNQYRAVVFA
jgi:hypothetical protein